MNRVCCSNADFQTGEHLVEDRRQLAQFAIDLLHVDATIEVRDGYARGRGTHQRDRPYRPARQQQPADQTNAQHAQPGQAETPGQPRQLALLLTDRSADQNLRMPKTANHDLAEVIALTDLDAARYFGGLGIVGRRGDFRGRFDALKTRPLPSQTTK